MFHSYVSLPEGTDVGVTCLFGVKSWLKFEKMWSSSMLLQEVEKSGLFQNMAYAMTVGKYW